MNAAQPLGIGPLEPDAELAPITDETLRRDDRRSEREQLMSDLGLREADFR